jgi:hypothetical protein
MGKRFKEKLKGSVFGDSRTHLRPTLVCEKKIYENMLNISKTPLQNTSSSLPAMLSH